MTEQEELIQDIRERLGEMPKGALPFNLLAFTTTIRTALLDDGGQNHAACYERSRGLRRQLPHRARTR
jgi:hypothetical protein